MGENIFSHIGEKQKYRIGGNIEDFVPAWRQKAFDENSGLRR